MSSNRRRFLQLAGLATLGSTMGAASANGNDTDGSEDTDHGNEHGGLQKPVRADEPTSPVQELLDTFAAQNAKHLYQLSTEEGRSFYQSFFVENADPEPVGDVEDRTIPGPDGEIPVRVYTPKSSSFDEPYPVSVYLHGGGWVLGDLDTHDSVARSLTNASEAMLVSVDYRKGPEHPFPAAINDSYAAAKWVANNASSIGADADRMAVVGESAGGDMSAVIAQMANASGDFDLVYQYLVYPVTDLSGSWVGQLPETFSILAGDEQQLDRRYLAPKDLPWFATRYLPYSGAAYNLHASPLLARGDRLEGTAPATVVTTGFGPLGDQGYLYAKHLDEADVPVSITHYPEMIHDFLNMEHLNEPYPDIPTATVAKRRAGETLKAAFENPEAAKNGSGAAQSEFKTCLVGTDDDCIIGTDENGEIIVHIDQ